MEMFLFYWYDLIGWNGYENADLYLIDLIGNGYQTFVLNWDDPDRNKLHLDLFNPVGIMIVCVEEECYFRWSQMSINYLTFHSGAEEQSHKSYRTITC